MIFYSQFIRTFIKSQEHRKASARKLARMRSSYFRFRHFIHHSAEYQMRRTVRHYMTCFDLRSVIQNYARYPAVLVVRQDLDRFRIKKHVPAKFTDPLHKRQRNLMRTHLRHARPALHVTVHHRSIMHKTQIIAMRA